MIDIKIKSCSLPERKVIEARKSCTAGRLPIGYFLKINDGWQLSLAFRSRLSHASPLLCPHLYVNQYFRTMWCFQFSKIDQFFSLICDGRGLTPPRQKTDCCQAFITSQHTGYFLPPTSWHCSCHHLIRNIII